MWSHLFFTHYITPLPHTLISFVIFLNRFCFNDRIIFKRFFIFNENNFKHRIIMSFLPIYYCTKTMCVIAKSRLWGVSAIYQLCSSLYSSFEIFLNFPFSFWKCISHLRKYFFFICHWVIDTLTAGLKTRVAQSIYLLIRLTSLLAFYPRFSRIFCPVSFPRFSASIFVKLYVPDLCVQSFLFKSEERHSLVILIKSIPSFSRPNLCRIC